MGRLGDLRITEARRANVAVAKKKKEKKSVYEGNVYIQATFNNTIITITDLNGNAIAWSSSGVHQFRGAKKSTPFAAQTVAETAVQKALTVGLREVHVYVKGPGVGRESAIRQLGALGLKVKSINDVTPAHLAMRATNEGV